MNDRFGSTARDFAAGIVTREGGTPEDVRELSYGPDLDRIVSDHRAEFDWNTVPGMGARVRDWYAEQFPDDPLGAAGWAGAPGAYIKLSSAPLRLACVLLI